jgi:predicted TIM-barrel fold metal-dependent hydrolase
MLGTTVSLAALPLLGAEKKLEIVDIHQHLRYSGRPDDTFVAHQRKMGITKSVLLPAGRPMKRPTTHDGKSNGLAAGVAATDVHKALADKYPNELVWFANAVPDLDDAQKILEGWLKQGAVGIGEQKFAIECDSVHMHKLAEVARAFDVPILIHFQHGMYNVGFERFHTVLKKYPEVIFIGHAQTMWGHVDKNHKPKAMYPKGKVTKGGLTDRYLADYANFYGDLSAGSGRNSLTRDMEHAAGFVDRHQDKLLYGSDCNDHDGHGGKCIGVSTLSVLKKLMPDEKVLNKVLSGNAKKIVKL